MKPIKAATKPRKPHTSIGVADQRSQRTASAIAHDLRWGKSDGDFYSREVDLTIEVPTDDIVTLDTGVSIECTANSYRAFQREIVIEDAQLGDLPLIVLALQEAIRVGVERGSFPEIRGDRKAKTA